MLILVKSERIKISIGDALIHRARQCYNRVPAEVRTGSVETVKKKLKQWVKANIPID